ncbi:MAG: hypothetical protein K0B15_05800 [Lentimicrobium sp.]|nr:hypothetical protein [Lentimicrobium sp.]
MKANILIILKKYIPIGILVLLFMGCERELSDLKPVTFPDNPEVFIDGFSAGLNYAAFGGSVPTAFDVDNKETWNNSKASMRFDVPNVGDPQGAYAGGVFFTETGRNLTGYNALTFWAKASESAVIDLVGLGNDLGASKYQVTISGLQVSTSWKKYIIPLPNSSVLTAERGMFFYSTGPVDGKGYTFWIDELKFENLGTIAHPQFAIFNGEEKVETSFIGVTQNISGLSATFNLPAGVNQSVNAAAAYFNFSSSNEGIATVNESGVVAVVGGPGSAEITARVGNEVAKGSLTLQSIGTFQQAPLPVHPADDVISIFSDAYTSVPVNYYNGYWEPYQTTLSADFEVNGDHILQYIDFNFVGIEFSTPTVDATAMTHLHMDIYIPNTLTADAQLKIELVNEGAASSATSVVNIPVSQSNKWIGLDLPFSGFNGLGSTAKLMQIIFVNENNKISSFYADNIYFYSDGTQPPPPGEPDVAAATPTYPAANVISVFSDAYTAIPGTNLNPDWGQATVVTTIQIQGNNTLKLAGLNYQGIEFGSSQNVTAMGFLHVDFWTANSTALNIFLISPGPVETAYSLAVPTTGWTSIDIPLSSFAPVNLGDVIQIKFDGNGDIYLDNIYFRKN